MFVKLTGVKYIYFSNFEIRIKIQRLCIETIPIGAL